MNRPHVRIQSDACLRSAVGTLEALRPLLQPGVERDALAVIVKGNLVAVASYCDQLDRERTRLGAAK